MKTGKLLTLVLLTTLMLSVINPVAQSNPSGSIRVVINGYDDGVIVDLYANLTGNTSTSAQSTFKLVLNAETTMPSEKQLITDGTLNLTVISEKLRENKVNANIWLKSKSIKGYGELYLKAKGNYTNVNGTLEFNVDLNSSGDANNTTVNLYANITIPLNMTGEETANQLVMMSAFLTERTVNLYLEQLNMTFIKFKTLQIEANIDRKKGMVYLNAKAVFYINSTEALLYREKYGGAPPIPGANVTTSGPASLPPIQTLFNPSKETNTSSSLNVTIKTIDNKLDVKAVFHGNSTGDFEKAAKEAHEEIIKTLKESNASIPPGLDEIYLAPNPSKIYVDIDGTNPGKVNINIVAEGIRLKHANLTGTEAQKRVASILLGYLAAIQSYLPSTINLNVELNNVAGAEPDNNVKEKAASYLEGFMHSIPIPVQPVTSTATLTTTHITSPITPTTSSPTKTTTTSSPTTTTTKTTQTTTPPPPTQTTPSTTASPTSTMSPPQSSTTPTTQTAVSSSGGNLWTWIGVATIIIVVIVAGILYIVLKKR